MEIKNFTVNFASLSSNKLTFLAVFGNQGVLVNYEDYKQSKVLNQFAYNQTPKTCCSKISISKKDEAAFNIESDFNVVVLRLQMSSRRL